MTIDTDNKVIPMEVGEQPEQAQAPAKAAPQPPENWGMSLEQARTLLAAKHKTNMPEDDPVLMLVTLMNAGTFEFDRMLTKHEEAVKTLFIAESKKYFETIDRLAKVLSSESAKAATEVFRRHSMTINTLRNQLWWMIGVVILTTLIHLAAGFILIGRQ